jgi:hypothetical protein
MNQEVINIINNTQIYTRYTSEWKEYKLKNLTSKIGSGATPRVN